MKKVIAALAIVLSAGALNAQVKMAHINSTKLLDTLPSRKEALKTLEEFSRRSEMELQEKEADLQKAYQAYLKAQPTNTATVNQYEEEKLQRKQQELQSLEQELQQKMSLLNNELNAPILKRMQKAVDIVADRKKINYIIDESQALYSKGGTDITGEVMTELLKLDRDETAKPASTTTAPATTAPANKPK